MCLACLRRGQRGGSAVQQSPALFLTVFFASATEPADFLPPSKPLTLSQTQSALFFLTKLKHNSLQRRKVPPPGLGVDTAWGQFEAVFRGSPP